MDLIIERRFRPGRPRRTRRPGAGWDTSTVNNDGVLNIEVTANPAHLLLTGNPPQPSVSVTKDAPAATYNLGQSFAWTITATVTNGPTTANYAIWDDIPAQSKSTR
ncbi:MAG: hypothetical protein IPH65_10415 [Dehalococcoidia bacterium]|uniref:hypothetical protein n=1 Tax=Candidatus Amarobacter glycogenicus TaxID=3140699 RepID=UPI003136B5D4|nr:hypothetical protein [Dehalococcoidia bacterium]